MRRKPLAAIACAVLAVTAFTACGDDDDDDAPTEEGETPATDMGSMPMDSTMTSTMTS